MITPRAAVCALSLCAALAFGHAAPEAAAPAAPVLGSARQLRFEVSDYRAPDGKAWIRLNCEFEAVFALSEEEILATLQDYENTPAVFSRVEAVRVRSPAGAVTVTGNGGTVTGDEVTVTEQRTAIRVLGLAFISNLVFKNTVKRSGTASATFTFETIETDDSCLSTVGAWELEDISDARGRATRLRYTMDSYAQPRFPGQIGIMRLFGAGDIKMLVRQLGEATIRRRG